MAAIRDGSSITVHRDGDDVDLELDGEDVGRIRGTHVEVGELSAELVVPGERATRVLLAGGRRPVLRLDPAGRKATWLTLSRQRCRLSRQRPGPLRRGWVLTRDVEGPSVLSVKETPLGTRVEVADSDGFTTEELEALVAGALTVVLDVPAAERSGV